MKTPGPASEAVGDFRREFGRAPEWLAWAPGRINLIGDHTDYNLGFVLPCAIDRGIAVAAGRSDSESRAVSRQEGVGAWSLGGSKPDNWARYPFAVATEMGAYTEICATVVSTLPPSGGVSSSAALEVAFATLYNDIESAGLTQLEIAQLCQQAENRTVGVQCGIMDMLASAAGIEGSALLIDTRSLNIEPVPIPEGIVIALLDTGKSRTLAGSAYNDRRMDCERAAASVNKASLRDVKEARIPEIPADIRNRARHVISENRRVLDFVDALKAKNLPKLGLLMAESHASLRNDYGVSCPELDAMVDAALKAGAIGARLTGAGFGGAAVALVEEQSVTQFLRNAEQYYRDRVIPFEPRLVACRPSRGAQILEVQGESSQF